MSRAVSSVYVAAAHGDSTAEHPVVLIVIDHADLASPIRIVDDTQDLVVGADTYIACPCEPTLPPDRDDGLPSCGLTIQNVDRAITDGVKALVGKASVSLRAVLRSSPTTVEAGPFDLTLLDVQANALTVSANLGPEEMLDETFPWAEYDPANAPGIF